MVQRMLLLLGSMFAVVGLILAVVCAVLTAGTVSFRSTAISAEGTITDVEQRRDCDEDGCTMMYTPVVEFTTASGDTVVFSPNSASNNQPQVGGTVTVLYQESDPQRARIDGFIGMWLGPVITGALGVVFVAVGLPLAIVQLRRIRTIAWLRSSGERRQATIVGVELNRRVRINERHPWQVVAVGTDPFTGAQLRFVSDDIRRDPRPALAGARTVDVLVDPKDPGRRYLMDLSNYALDL